MPVLDERGYIIVAADSDDIIYTECALACARSIKIHTPDAKIALLTNDKRLPDCYNVFDYIIEFPHRLDFENPLSNDWQVFDASPFQETIKIESDMVIPHSIEHWWTMLRHKDVVLTIGARNYHNNPTNERHYRKIFDENNLPDVYNAITYWRVSDLSLEFAKIVRYLFLRWDLVQPAIKMGLSDAGTTDLVYAIAAKIIGVENVTLPGTSYPTLIHMKPKINWLTGEDWTKELVWELNNSNIRINTIDQQYPFHYQLKEFSRVLNFHYDTLL